MYTDNLPKGLSARLYVEMDVDGEPLRRTVSARAMGGNEFGFVPTIIIEADGWISLSSEESEMRVARQ